MLPFNKQATLSAIYFPSLTPNPAPKKPANATTDTNATHDLDFPFFKEPPTNNLVRHESSTQPCNSPPLSQSSDSQYLDTPTLSSTRQSHSWSPFATTTTALSRMMDRTSHAKPRVSTHRKAQVHPWHWVPSSLCLSPVAQFTEEDHAKSQSPTTKHQRKAVSGRSSIRSKAVAPSLPQETFQKIQTSLSPAHTASPSPESFQPVRRSWLGPGSTELATVRCT